MNRRGINLIKGIEDGDAIISNGIVHMGANVQHSHFSIFGARIIVSKKCNNCLNGITIVFGITIKLYNDFIRRRPKSICGKV